MSQRIGAGGTRAFWTDRHGGVAAAPYDSANLGAHVGDRAEAVRENRERLARVHQVAPPDEWTWREQVHGADVATVTGPGARATADAAVIAEPGIPLVVLTADCAPIAIADVVVGETVDGLPALDLAAAVRAAFAECGVGDVADDRVCTYADVRYFSHRRDDVTGRQAVVVVKA